MRSRWLSCLLLVLAHDAFAHRLDEYLQATRVAVASNRIDLSIDLTPGVAVVDPVLAAMDLDGDGHVSENDRVGYARRFLDNLSAQLDQKPVTFRLESIVFPTLHEIKGGLGVIRIKASAPIPSLAPGSHLFCLTNSHLPDISAYLVNALVPKDPAMRITGQSRDELQQGYGMSFSMGAPKR